MINYEISIAVLKVLVIPIIYTLITFFFERKKNPNKKSFIKLIVLFIKFYFAFLCGLFFVVCSLIPLMWYDDGHIPPKTLAITLAIIMAITLITIHLLKKHLSFNEINLFAVCHAIIFLTIVYFTFSIDEVPIIIYLAFSILFCWLVFTISILSLLIKMIAKFIHSRKKDKNNADENIKE